MTPALNDAMERYSDFLSFKPIYEVPPHNADKLLAAADVSTHISSNCCKNISLENWQPSPKTINSSCLNIYAKTRLRRKKQHQPGNTHLNQTDS